MPIPLQILIVEDSEDDAELLTLELEINADSLPCKSVNASDVSVSAEWQITHVRDIASALKSLSEGCFDIILLDLSLPDSLGLNTVTRLQTCSPNIPIVVLTGYDDRELALQAVAIGAQDYLVKGQISGSELWRAIRHAIERGQIVKQLQESERRFRGIFDQTFQSMGLLTPEGIILEINQTALNFSGAKQENVVGSPLWESECWNYSRSIQEWLKTAVANASKGDFVHNEIQVRRPVDGIVWIDFSLKPLKDEKGVVVLLIAEGRDISDRKQAELELQQGRDELEIKVRERTASLALTNESLQKVLHDLQQTQKQLIQTEKISSLGQLVAGVAHEINNPISFIYGNITYANQYTQDLLNLIQLYQKHYPNAVPEIQEEAEAIELDFVMEDLPQLLGSMTQGADRICEIVLSLRNFSRHDEAQMKLVDIHSGIDSTLVILQHRFKAKGNFPGIQVIKEYGDLPQVECYPGQLNQVFMNLLANAIDALEESLVISHSSFTNDNLTIRISTQQLNFDFVEIRIADNGFGIPTSVRQKLFDPFFTTKPEGKGTGLGLSISYQIVVEKHGGQLKCISDHGKGAEFIIKIPIRQTSNIICG